MALELINLCFAAVDPARLASFWSAALRWPVRGDAVVPDDGTRFGVRFVAAAAPPPKLEKNRLHLDLTSSSPDDQATTVEQLLALGGSHADVGQRGDEGHVVLADPEGNELCIIEPDNSFLSTCGRLGSITCDGSRSVGVFWSEVLGWPLVWDQDEETAVRAPDGAGPFVTWAPPVLPKVQANRLWLELSVAGIEPAEVDRLVALGARRSGVGPDRLDFIDPDGNEFTVVRS